MKSKLSSELEQIPGVGKSSAQDLNNLDIHSIQDLKGSAPVSWECFLRILLKLSVGQKSYKNCQIMNAQEQNWTNLFSEHSHKGISWHGIWTRYSPEKEVLKSFMGVRSFQTNEDKIVINQKNNYTYEDGSTQEKTWQIEKQTCNQPDGVIHPAFLSMRALSFGQGATAWVSKTLKAGEKFGAELFFRYKDWRNSVASIYGETGGLERITHIREHLNSFSNQPPDLEVENISGKWRGKKEYMTYDLKVSPAEETQELVLDPTRGKNETFFLPDRIVVNFPKMVKLGKEFELVAAKLVSDNEYKRLTAKYDNSGEFALLISEVFRWEE